MSVLTKLLKRAEKPECGHHWHRQFTGVWHCCVCWTDTDERNPAGTAACVRSAEDSFEFELATVESIVAASRPARRRRRADAAA